MDLFRKCDPDLKPRVKGAVIKLSKNPNTPALRLKPLEGVEGVWSIRVNDNFRILLRIAQDKDGPPYYLLTDMGNHDVYRPR
jgi:hypothetical protein